MKLLITLTSLLIFVFGANAQLSMKQGFGVVEVTKGFDSSTSMAFLPDGRIIVTEQDGRILMVKNGTLLPTPIYTLQSQTGDDKGLMGIAIDPEFSSNGYIYLYHTLPDGSRNKVSRLTLDGDLAIDNSQTTILLLDSLKASWHNGGSMRFGIDGKLYVCTGDNSQRSVNSQNLDSYWGKILRINKDGSIPEGNPYTEGSEQKRRVWGYGLRNPYTMDLHEENGTIYINDVGSTFFEEINDATEANKNFGHAEREGFDPTNTYDNPVYAYGHIPDDEFGNPIYTDSSGNAIVGGAFLDKESNYPDEYNDVYFFCNLSGWINYITPGVTGSRKTLLNLAKYGYGMTYLTQGPDGNLYFFNRSEGSLWKLIYLDTDKPIITSEPKSFTVTIGQRGTLNVSAIGLPELSYQWQKNGANISNATKSTFTFGSATAGRAGDYRCIVSNAYGSDTSALATVIVEPFNALPIAEITSPVSNFKYSGGDTIEFSGIATDLEDGVLSENSFIWTLDFLHNDHIHPSGVITEGAKNGSFVISNVGELAHDVYYRLTLEVTDSKGQKAKASVDIMPNKVTLNFVTSPAGFTVNFDGPNKQTPLEIMGVTGMKTPIETNLFQQNSNDGDFYYLDKWLNTDGLNYETDIPEENTTYTAVFREIWENSNSRLGANTINGIKFKYYKTNRNNLSFSRIIPERTGTIINLDLDEISYENNKLGVHFETYFSAPTDGLYKFYLSSNGKSSLTFKKWPETDVVILNHKKSGEVEDGFGVIGLKQGVHKMIIRYSNFLEVEPVFHLQFEGPSISKQDIPSNMLLIKNTSGRESEPTESINNEITNSNQTIKTDSISTFEILSVYPNPANSIVNIKYQSNTNEIVPVKIIDLSGKIIYENNFEVTAGWNQLTIFADDIIGNGYVILKIYSSTGSFNKSLIINK